ncbi:MAG TPA: 50S ribosomal protein L6 [Patescibacteria group bacterium]|nr:50S ribosomal protein L6 [Patescibacteria group bacterium]
MSKIGKTPIQLKEGTTVTIDQGIVKVSGVKGTSEYQVPSGIVVTMQEGKLIVAPKKKSDREISAVFGLVRASLANIVKGLETGFEKKLELIGVGYRAQMQGSDLVLSLGFSHPVKFRPVDGVQIQVAENVITVSGVDKTLVGEAAAKIRSFRPPEPYKGKGIKYVGEWVRRKAGKAAKAVGAVK